MRISELNNVFKVSKALKNYSRKNGIEITERRLNIMLACYYMNEANKIITLTKLRDKLSEVSWWYDSETIAGHLRALEEFGCFTKELKQRRGFKAYVYTPTVKLDIMLFDIARKARHTKIF